jgi:hypothetical protein
MLLSLKPPNNTLSQRLLAIHIHISPHDLQRSNDEETQGTHEEARESDVL